MSKYKYDLGEYNVLNALVIHAERNGHLPNWRRIITLHEDMTKSQRRVRGGVYINQRDVTNTVKCFFQTDRVVACFIKNFTM